MPLSPSKSAEKELQALEHELPAAAIAGASEPDDAVVLHDAVTVSERRCQICACCFPASLCKRYERCTAQVAAARAGCVDDLTKGRRPVSPCQIAEKGGCEQALATVAAEYVIGDDPVAIWMLHCLGQRGINLFPPVASQPDGEIIHHPRIISGLRQPDSIDGRVGAEDTEGELRSGPDSNAGDGRLVRGGTSDSTLR